MIYGGKMEENSVVKEFMNEIRDIRFKNVDEFMAKREFIRENTIKLNNDFKEMYKWYFYHQLCLLSQKFFEFKDLMWMYTIGEPVEFELTHQYRLFCDKRNKIDYGN